MQSLGECSRGRVPVVEQCKSTHLSHVGGGGGGGHHFWYMSFLQLENTLI